MGSGLHLHNTQQQPTPTTRTSKCCCCARQSGARTARRHQTPSVPGSCASLRGGPLSPSWSSRSRCGPSRTGPGGEETIPLGHCSSRLGPYHGQVVAAGWNAQTRAAMLARAFLYVPFSSFSPFPGYFSLRMDGTPKSSLNSSTVETLFVCNIMPAKRRGYKLGLQLLPQPKIMSPHHAATSVTRGPTHNCQRNSFPPS